MDVSTDTIAEAANPFLAPTDPSRTARSARHLSQGCILSGLRDGFFGNAIERHHRPEKGRQVLKWL